MSDHTELMRRAEELAVDVQTALYAEKTEDPESVDAQLTETALTHVLTAGLLLKGTTTAFKAEMEAKK